MSLNCLSLWVLLVTAGVLYGGENPNVPQIDSGIRVENERPKIPEAGRDLVLANGKTIEEFFASRKTATECRQRIVELRSAVGQAKQHLAELVSKGAPAEEINMAEETQRKKRKLYVKAVGECGDCATRKIEHRIVEIDGRKGNWYIADGSCLIDSDSASKAARAYLDRRDSLLLVSKYATHTGGLSNILSFQLVDPETGEIITGRERIQVSPYYSFIAVRGPHLFGYYTAAAYYQKAYFSETEKAGIGQFSLKYEAEPLPSGFRPPDIFEHFASGEKQPVKHVVLSDAQGSWYLDSGGYLRYHTAADFGLTLKFMEDLAQEILLETLVEMSERGTN